MINQDWIEGDLYFDFTEADYVINFDQSGGGHGLSHIFKAVDFVVEDKNHLLFIEIKNPENSNIPEQHKEKELKHFSTRLQSGKLYEDLLIKLKDSLIFQSLDSGIPHKKFIYIVFIGMQQLDTAMLANLKDTFIQSSPILSYKWEKPFEIIFLNFEHWNRWFVNYPITFYSEKK